MALPDPCAQPTSPCPKFAKVEFVVSRLDAAKSAAEANPTLCKILAEPLAKFRAEVSGLVDKAKGGTGSISPRDVAGGGSYLSGLHDAAAKGGAAFTDNQNTSA